MEGLVFDIQGYSVHDGSGCRTLVFLSGCPLRCAWCANPEGQLLRPRVMYRADMCDHTHYRCVRACPNNAIQRNPETGAMETVEDRCIRCHMCALACPFGATLVGPEKEVLRCDLCGGDPECVKRCETRAIQFLPRSQLATMKMRHAVKDLFPDLLKTAQAH